MPEPSAGPSPGTGAAPVPASFPGSGPARASLAVATAGVLWGVSAVVVKAAFNRSVDPLALVQARLIVAPALLAPVLALVAPRLLRIGWRDLPAIAGWAVFGLLTMQASYFWTVSLAGVATAIFLQYTAPVLTALWESLVARRRLGAGVIAALGLCLAGTAALLFGGGVELRLSPAVLVAGLLSAAGNAVTVVLGRRAQQRRRLGSATLFLYGMLVALVASLALRSPAATVSELLLPHPGLVLYVAIGATLLPFLLYLSGAADLSPTRTILLAMLEPVVGSLLAWRVLGENLTATQGVGAGLVLAGVAAASLRTGAEPAAATSDTDPAV